MSGMGQARAMDDSTAQFHALMPMTATLGIQVVRDTPEEIGLTLDWKPELCTSNALMHGGAIMALADSAGGACAFRNLPEGATGTSTIESKTNFLGGVKSGTVTATARPLHVGGTTIVIETEVRDDRGKLVAKVTQTQVVLRGRP
jgi:1,4-dihydroxy-2-naphthoyl-CoA hydrolase